MKKLLFMSDGSWTPSGFGTVMKNLINRLKNDYEIAILSWQHVGCMQEFDNIKYYPVGQHQFGKDMLPYVIEDFKPDYLITLGDYWMVDYIAEPKMQELLKKHSTQWVWYIPIDSDIIPIQYIELLAVPDILVTMSQHGKRTAQGFGYDSVYIPHGIDTSIYYPTDKDIAKKKWNYEDKFIITAVARNQDRKQLPRLLKAFAIFQKGKPEVRLHMHCDLLDSANLANAGNGKIYSQLGQAMFQLGIESKVHFTKKLHAIGYINGMADKELAELYNASDIHAISTSGEGFGLPIMESLACGIPNVLTDYTTTKEFLGDNERGIRVPYITTLWGGFGSERAIVDEEEMARAFEILYNNKRTRTKMGKNAAEFAKQYDWNIIIKDWKKLLV